MLFPNEVFGLDPDEKTSSILLFHCALASLNQTAPDRARKSVHPSLKVIVVSPYCKPALSLSPITYNSGVFYTNIFSGNLPLRYVNDADQRVGRFTKPEGFVQL